MKQFSKLLLVGLMIALLGALIVPTTAQDGERQGGIIIEGQAGADPSTLDPLLSSDTTSADIQEFIFPDLLAVDTKTASIIESGPGALVSGWTISEDGKTYTFTLRQDMFWNDGTQITAKDVQYTWDAITSGEIESPLFFVTDAIVDVRTVDDFTMEFEFAEADCDALLNAGVIEPYPSHIAPATFAELPDAEFALNPYVSAGVFSFGEMRPSEAITLLADQAYVDADLGFVNPDGYIAKTVPDLTVNVEQFLAGELNVIDGPQEARRADIYAQEEVGEVSVYTYPGNAWDYLAFNLADPENPQDGADADGNIIDQGMHPLFGNTEVGKDVRRALNLALNIDEIIEGATFGEGTRMTSMITPVSWAYNTELPPVEYNPELAAQMLDEAGWVMGDDGVRVCQGCATAEDGTRFEFDIMTNEENARRTAIITIASDQWSQIGVKANIQTIEFFTMLDIMDGQTWDAFVLGWQAGYPDGPDQTQLFTPVGDVVGGGSNDGSYNNPRFNELNQQARTLAGCDQAERSAIYWEMQEIAQADTPYIFLFVRNGFYAVRNTVEGFNPDPSQLWWNVDTWSVNASE